MTYVINIKGPIVIDLDWNRVETADFQGGYLSAFGYGSSGANKEIIKYNEQQ
jgi:hypothetical protein